MPTQALTSEERFWNLFTQYTTRGFYLEEVANRSEIIERWLNGVLAFTSSASIATWAIWKEYPMVWGGIIALSQIIQAIKPILPYRTRQTRAMAALHLVEPVLLTMEEDWYKLSYGSMSAKKLEERIIHHKRALQKIEAEQFKDSRLPPNGELKKRAEQATEKYLKEFWGMDTLKLETKNVDGNPQEKPNQHQ